MSRDTKGKLIETAIDLIWSESYHAVSVDEICRKADVKKGSFYHYFPSKSHLAVETMDYCMQDIKAHYDDMFSPTRAPVERFSLMVRYIVEMQKEICNKLGHVCGCPVAALGSEVAGQDPVIGNKTIEISHKKAAYFESALRDMVADGTLPKDADISLKARQIQAYIIGNLMMARIHNDLGFLEANLECGLFDLLGINMPATETKKLTA